MVDQRKRPVFTIGRFFDALAILVIAFVAWKIFIAPRVFKPDATAFPAPHVAYKRLNGDTFALAAQKGQVVFLDFYASWCEPCRLEIPMVVRYARAHPEINVAFVDVGEPAVVASSFARKFELGNVAIDPTSSAQGFFSIQGFPTIVVIDPQGRLRATWPGFNPAIALAMSNAEKQLR